MHIHTRNVGTAFRTLVELFDNQRFSGKHCDVRRVPYSNPNGSGFTLRVDEPVTITYERPCEAVLFNAARDVNPFSVMYEGLYHLCGRKDTAPLAYYTPNFKTFSDDLREPDEDGYIGSLNGSYGYRWRCAAGVPELTPAGYYRPGVDQLDLLVAHLRANPTSRRAVLTMWNVEDDLLKVGGTGNRIRCKTCHGIGGVNQGPQEPDDGISPDRWTDCPACGRTGWTDEPGSRDVACNLSVKFSVRDPHDGLVAGPHHPSLPPGTPLGPKVLDMTVFNRSNDLCWGALGANVVTFSFLLQYMAARLGVGVGRYNQISDDLHVYDRHAAEMPKWLAEPDQHAETYGQVGSGNPFQRGFVTVPLVRDPATFDREVKLLVDVYWGGPERNGPQLQEDLTEPFLWTVARPALAAFALHKEKRPEAAVWMAEQVAADDWRIACVNWIKRRQK